VPLEAKGRTDNFIRSQMSGLLPLLFLSRGLRSRVAERWPAGKLDDDSNDKESAQEGQAEISTPLDHAEHTLVCAQNRPPGDRPGRIRGRRGMGQPAARRITVAATTPTTHANTAQTTLSA
jgi:hypothetical protein